METLRTSFLHTGALLVCVHDAQALRKAIASIPYPLDVLLVMPELSPETAAALSILQCTP